jgi:hypothetical protein
VAAWQRGEDGKTGCCPGDGALGERRPTSEDEYDDEHEDDLTFQIFRARVRTLLASWPLNQGTQAMKSQRGGDSKKKTHELRT